MKNIPSLSLNNDKKKQEKDEQTDNTNNYVMLAMCQSMY
jgi:hypothetical protein